MPRGGKRPGAGRPGGWKTGPAKVSVSLPADLVEAVMAYARALDTGEVIRSIENNLMTVGASEIHKQPHAVPSNESPQESIALKAAALEAREQADRLMKRLELARRLLARERDRARVRREELDRIAARLLDTRGSAVRAMEDAELWDFARPINPAEAQSTRGTRDDSIG